MKLKYSNLHFRPKTVNDKAYTIRATFSTQDKDRHGEHVDQKTWDVKDFMTNPVVLFGHNHNQPPIGVVTELGFDDNGNLEGEIKFAAEEYPFAKTIWNLYKGGYMKAISVGFMSAKKDIEGGNTILRDNVLLEVSTVSIPANAMALAKSKGIDIQPLEDKFVELEDEAEATEAVETETSKDDATIITPDVEEEKEEVVEEVVVAEAVAEEIHTDSTIKSLLTQTVDEEKERESLNDELKEFRRILEAFNSIVYGWRKVDESEDVNPKDINVNELLTELVKLVISEYDLDLTMTGEDTDNEKGCPCRNKPIPKVKPKTTEPVVTEASAEVKAIADMLSESTPQHRKIYKAIRALLDTKSNDGLKSKFQVSIK